MKKRLLSLFLALVMTTSLLPVLSTPAAAAEPTKGAFGLSPEEPLTEAEKWKYLASAPFGAINQSNQDENITLNQKSELFLSYGWDVNKGGAANWMRTFDASPGGESVGDLQELVNVDNRYTTAASNKTDWKAYFADSAGFNPGSGKDQYIAYLYFTAGGPVHLKVLDRGLNQKADVYVSNNHVSPSKIDSYEGGGMLAVVGGDFDRDGKDTIVINTAGEGLREYSFSGSSLSPVVNRISAPTIDSILNNGRTFVKLVAEDVDRDGYDELVASTSSGNGGSGSYLCVLDKIDGAWSETYARQFSEATGFSADVGNVIASASEDMPEIVAAGFTPGRDDKFKYFVLGFDGWQSQLANGENWTANYKIIMSGETDSNDFTEGGHYHGDGYIHPIQVACFNYQGGANAEAAFISGSVYTFSNAGESGDYTMSKAYTYGYFNDDDDGRDGWLVANNQIEDVAVGNFDGNNSGREQVAFVTLAKQSGRNNSWSFMAIYKYTPKVENDVTQGGDWSAVDGNWFIGRKGKSFVTLTSFDDDTDSVVAKYSGLEKTYSKPDVLAVLETFPYFEELGDDAWGESTVTYSTKTGGGSSISNSHSLHTSIVAGFEYTDPITGSGGGIESTIENNFTWATEKETTREYALEFANNSGQNQVVVYRTPVLDYTYKNVNGGSPIHIQKALDPEYAMIPLEDYNAQAANYDMTIIDESKLCEPGNPFSYPANWSGATAADMVNGKDADVGTNWVAYSTNGNITQGFEYEETNTKSFTYDLSVDFSAYAICLGIKFGYGAGYGYEYTTSTINTNGVDKSGTINGIGNDYPGYDFQWRFAHWMADFSGDKIPVLGFLVQNQTAPPSPAVNLSGSDITTDSFTLTWDEGSRPANEYRVYIQYGEDDYELLGVVDRPEFGADYGYKVDGLQPGETYTFVVRGYGDGKESVDSESYTLTTNADSEQRVNINKVDDVTVPVGGTATFRTTVDLVSAQSVSYHWQYREKGKNVWQDVTGVNSTLTLPNVTKEMDGNQYRLMVTARVGVTRYTYYSNTATLTIGANPTEATVSMRGFTDGSGTKEAPYTGQGSYIGTTEKTEPQEQTFNGAFEHNGHTDPVYTVDGKQVAVCTITDPDTKVSTKTYYEVALAEDKSVSPEGYRELPTSTKWVTGDDDADVETSDLVDFDGETVSKVVGSDTYYQMAEWIETDGAITPGSVKTYWIKLSDAETKYYDEAEGGSFTESAFSPSMDENAYTSPVYKGSTALKLILTEDDGMFAMDISGADLKTGANGARDPSFQKVRAKVVINVGGTEVDVDTVTQMYTYTQQVMVTTTEEKSSTGNELTLNGVLRYQNSGAALPAGTAGSFVIVNMNTGTAATINATVSGNQGRMSSTWIAPTPGLYAIRATTPSTSTLGAAVSTNTIYYQAGGDPDATEYRIVTAGTQVSPESVIYGNSAILELSTRTGSTGSWSNVSDLSGKYIELITPDRESEKLDTLTLSTSGRPAGTYTVRVWASESEYDQYHLSSPAKALASASIRIDYAKVTISPDRKDVALPTNLNQIGVKQTHEGGVDTDFNELSQHIEVVCGLYEKDGSMPADRFGRYTVFLQWKEDDASQKYKEKIEASYQVTLESDSIERLVEIAPVNFQSGVGGSISGAVTSDNSTLNFASGQSQRFGSTLQFTAHPTDNHYVSEWKFNGQVLDKSELPVGVTITEMGSSSSEVLRIDSFGQDHLAEADGSTPEGQLTVEVSFTNQRARVQYGSNGGGNLTAALSSGSGLENGANINYGATIVFTAAPNAGQMVESWTVNGDMYKYSSGETYRENTLTLSDIQQADVMDGTLTVTVTFTTEKKVNVNYSMVAQAAESEDWVIFSGGSISVTTSDGRLIPGHVPGNSGTLTSTQGKALTFTAEISEADQNAVRQWQFRTSAEGDWVTVEDSNGQNSFTYENPDTDTLEVRVCIDRAQVYSLSWGIKMKDNSEVPEEAQAELTAMSNSQPIEQTSHTAHIAVDFTLSLSDDYYVVGWEGAEGAKYSKTAKISALTQDTEVTVTIAEKPKVTLPEVGNGNSVTVTGTYNGIGNVTFPHDTGNLHFDPGTSFTVKAVPADDYYVAEILGEPFTPAHGEQTYTSAQQTEDFTITVVFKEKPRLTLPETYENGTLTVKGTFNGAEKTWTVSGSDKTGADNLHYDPGTGITVTVEPNMGYVLNRQTGWTISPNSDDATRTYTMDQTANGLDINTSNPTLRQLGKITVHFFVISEGGWKGPEDESAVAHGTLSAEVSRKGIAEYAADGKTSGEETDNIDDYTVDLYEDGSITLTAEGITGTSDAQTQAHSVDFWSTDKDGDFGKHFQVGGRDYIDNELTRTYNQVKTLAGESNELYIGVCFSPAGTRVSFGMVEEQEELGSVKAAIDTGDEIANGNDIGANARVTFTGTINDPEHYEVKYWWVGDEPREEETGIEFSCAAEGRNLSVSLELQGKVLEHFATATDNEHGKASFTPSGDAVRYKESVTLTAEPDPGYEFDGWYYDGQPVDGATTAEYVLTEPNDGTYTAHFKPKEGLSLNFEVNGEGGAITAKVEGGADYTSGQPTLLGGQVVTLTLTLEDGYRLKKTGAWTGLPEDAEVSEDGLTVTLPALTDSLSETITANVEKIPEYTVTVEQPQQSLKISAYVDNELQDSTSFMVREGTQVTFKYTYVEGPSYVFSGWLVDGEPGGSDPELTLTVTKAVTVSANTTIGLMYRLEIKAEGTGNVTGVAKGLDAAYGNGTYNLPKDSLITFTAAPGEGQMLDSWTVNDEVQNTDAGRPNLELTLPEYKLDQDTTVTVKFTEKKEYEYPETQNEAVYTVDNVSSYPSGENSGVTDGNYRVGGDLKFTIKPAEGAEKELMMPYIDGFTALGEEVSVTENENGGWDVEIHGVKDEVKLPSFRVKLEDSIPDDAITGLKTDDVFAALQEYLPEDVTQASEITGQVIEDVMTQVVTKAMPGASDDNVQIYDVALQQYDENHWETITSVEDFPEDGLTVILPYPEGTDSGDTFTVIHMFTVESKDKTHNPGDRETFTKADGTLQNTAAGLQFHVSSLSPIAVAWIKYVAPSGGGGGFGGGAEEANPVTVPENVPGGVVSADKEEAAPEEEVTLTVTPNSGFTVGALKVTDANGESVEVTDNGDGTYTFRMPDTGVQVTAAFVLDCLRDDTCPMLPFVDASRQAWYHDGVHYCVKHSLMRGLSTTIFAPEDATNRAMVVTILYRLENEPDAGNSAFVDVPAGAWYANAVAWAAANGIVDGYTDTVFGPEDPVTREQIAAILYRYAKYKRYDVSRQADLSCYTDDDRVSGYAVAGIRWAVAEGLIEGTSATTLTPTGNSTRAQVATILMRFCEGVAK